MASVEDSECTGRWCQRRDHTILLALVLSDSPWADQAVLTTHGRGTLMTESSDRKVALITGANKGIGFEVARQLGALGWRVLLGARDSNRGTGRGRRIEGTLESMHDSNNSMSLTSLPSRRPRTASNPIPADWMYWSTMLACCWRADSREAAVRQKSFHRSPAPLDWMSSKHVRDQRVSAPSPSRMPCYRCFAVPAQRGLSMCPASLPAKRWRTTFVTAATRIVT